LFLATILAVVVYLSQSRDQVEIEALADV